MGELGRKRGARCGSIPWPISRPIGGCFRKWAGINPVASTVERLIKVINDQYQYSIAFHSSVAG